MTPRFTARKLRDIETRPGCWQHQLIGVFDGDQQIGEYLYNYHSDVPFYAFRQGEDWLALVSIDYTATSVMSLPDCRILGGEPRATGGFCPVEFYVPSYYWLPIDLHKAGNPPRWACAKMYDDRTYTETDNPKDSHWLYETVGFRSGCVWGDDTSWKLQALDLKQAKQGIVTPINIGYVELAPYPLRECLELAEDDGDLYGIRVCSLKHVKLGVETNEDDD